MNEQQSNQYPRPYDSGLMAIGSRTIDNGHSFRFSVDNDGFHAVRELGSWNPDDLFNELGYWPQTVLWHDTSDSLLQLLANCACKNGYDPDLLLSMVSRAFCEYEIISSLDGLPVCSIPDEMTEQFSELTKGINVYGLPSEQFETGTHYNALRISIRHGLWCVKLYGETGTDVPELLIRTERWDAPTFDQLLLADGDYSRLVDCLPWGRNDLVNILVRDDQRWGSYISNT